MWVPVALRLTKRIAVDHLVHQDALNRNWSHFHWSCYSYDVEYAAIGVAVAVNELVNDAT